MEIKLDLTGLQLVHLMTSLTFYLNEMKDSLAVADKRWHECMRGGGDVDTWGAIRDTRERNVVAIENIYKQIGGK